jgi:tetratricopeptide (TPR) repeat protein
MTASWTHYKLQALKATEAKNYSEAEKGWQEAMKEAEAFGEDDGRYVLSLDSLAHTYYSQGLFARAEPLYKKALTIRESVFSPEHKDVATSANNLATVMFEQGKYKEAEALYDRALKIREKSLGKNSKEVSYVLYQLGMVLHAQKKYERAEDFYKQALEIKNKLFGPDHVELVHLLRNYAHLLRKTNREPTAVQMEQFATSIAGKQKT